MNRFAIAGMLIIASTAAVAGDYEAASDKQLLCEAMGAYAVQKLHSTDETAGRPPIPGVEKVKEYIDRELQKDGPFTDESARMMAWSHCMDNLGRDVREGQ